MYVHIYILFFCTQYREHPFCAIPWRSPTKSFFVPPVWFKGKSEDSLQKQPRKLFVHWPQAIGTSCPGRAAAAHESAGCGARTSCGAGIKEAGGPLGVAAPTLEGSIAEGPDNGARGFPSESLGNSLERTCLLGGPC